MNGNKLMTIAKIATFTFLLWKIECSFMTDPLIFCAYGEMPSGEPAAELRVPYKLNGPGALA
jgi:hypothetical protein